MGFPYHSAFIALIVCEVLHIGFISTLAKRICGLDMPLYLRSVIFPCSVSLMVYLIMFMITMHYEGFFMISVLCIILNIFIITIIMYLFGINQTEKELLLNILKRK